MKPIKGIFLYSLLILFVIGLNGCMDLEVENPNEPDADLALASASDVESLLGGAYRTYWDMLHWGQNWDWPSVTMAVMAWSASSSWGNFGMLDHGGLPRSGTNNRQDYTYFEAMYELPWYGSYGAISATIDAMHAVEAGVFTDPARIARVQAFSKFVQGVVHGWLALYFDQAFVFDESIDLVGVVEGTVDLELQPYPQMYQAAMGYLQDAIDIANAGPDFTLPSGWMRGNSDINNAKLIQLANTVKARITAYLPRTPADRANVNWQEVIGYLDAGLQDDFYIESEFPGWYDAYRIITQQTTWTGASYYTIGITDESGQFQEWLNTDPELRESFDIETSDRRIHGEDGPLSRGKYFANQGGDWFQPARGMYFQTRYLFQRWCPDQDGNRYCDWGMGGRGVHFPKAEADFLRAEALFRLNATANKEQIVEIVNTYRVGVGEMEPVTTDISNDDLWEIVKYEKRLETYSTHPGISFFDARGWDVIQARKDMTFGDSDLPVGTPVHFPVPVSELAIWEMDGYDFGGPDGLDAAAKARIPSPVPPAPH